MSVNPTTVSCPFCSGPEICPRCQGTKNAAFATCWQCRLDEAYEKGLAEGRRSVPARLDATRIRQFLQLLHPDKLGASPAATEATQWLLLQRKLLEAANNAS